MFSSWERGGLISKLFQDKKREERKLHKQSQDVEKLVSIHEPSSGNIRILYECEVLIENSVPRVTVWHHKAMPTSILLGASS